MARAERGRQNGWLNQATGLVASHSALATTAVTVAERGGPLLKRRKLALVAPPDQTAPPSEAIEIELARELDAARAEITGLQRRVSIEATAARALRERVQTSAAATAAAEQRVQGLEKRAQGLETEAGAVRNDLQEKLDAATAENAHLFGRFTERGLALDDAQERIKFLEAALAATEARADGKRAEGVENGLGEAKNQLQGKLEEKPEGKPEVAAAAAETARLSQSAVATDDALVDARARIEFLQAALTAAEAECTRLTGELGGAGEELKAQSNMLNGEIKAMSVRAAAAEKELAQARERLLARIVEIDAVRQKAAVARAASDEAYAKHRQLEDALCLQQCQVEDLERSRSTLIEAAQNLVQTFEGRDRALISAQQTIKHLVERNAQLEARAGGNNGTSGTERRSVQQQGARTAVQHGLQSALQSALQPGLAGTDQMSRQEWAELARLLYNFMERKRRSSGQAGPGSMTLLAGTLTF
jgi:chromosome segregation ATPase